MSENGLDNGHQEGKRSGVEIVKEQSNHLRGTVKATLESDAAHFSDQEYQLLKFHRSEERRVGKECRL